MFAIPRRTIPALARSHPSPRASILRILPRHPSQLRFPLSGPLSQPRHFSATSRSQVQYTRFSNGQDTYYIRRSDREKYVKIGLFVTAIGAVYVVAHLEQVPETGRWRFMDISPRLEAKLERASYESLLSEFGGKILPAHHPITLHVRRVVSGLLESSDLGSLDSTGPRTPSAGDDGLWSDDPFEAASSSRDTQSHASSDRGAKEWKLLVVNDPKIINALASFGTIVVFTGILPVCKNEAGLAGVVGHEIGHAVARHASEKYSRTKLLIIFATILEAAGIDFGVTRLLNYLVFELPHSRAQELEADTLGMRIAARACYDPQSAVEMHTRLAKASESGGLANIEFLRTHPVPERRIKHLQGLMPEGYEIRASSPRCAGVHQSIEQFLGSVNLWS